MTFEQIYKKFNNKVCNYIKFKVKDEMIAEELAADVMIKVYKKLEMFDETKSTLTTWIFNIAKNTVIDYFRKAKLNTVSLENVMGVHLGEDEPELDHIKALTDTESNPLDKMIETEISDKLYKKFDTLSESQKVVASLHFFDGLSYDEVAEQLSLPLGTVKAKLHFARKILMEALPVGVQTI